MFLDYKVATDDVDRRYIDSPGFNHHEWAPTGTLLQQNETPAVIFANHTTGSYCFAGACRLGRSGLDCPNKVSIAPGITLRRKSVWNISD